MKKDFVLQTLENIDSLLTKISFSDEDSAIVLQRDIIRSLDSCLEHIDTETKKQKIFTCANYFRLINKINRDVCQETDTPYENKSAVYESQKSNIVTKVRKVRNKLLPSALRLGT